MGIEKTIASIISLLERGIVALEKIAGAMESDLRQAELRRQAEGIRRINEAQERAVPRGMEGEATAQREVAVAEVGARREAEKATPAEEERAKAAPAEGKEAKAAPEKVSIDQVRKALAEFGKREGTPAAIELLGTFGAKRLSELDPSKYAEVLAACGGN